MSDAWHVRSDAAAAKAVQAAAASFTAALDAAIGKAEVQECFLVEQQDGTLTLVGVDWEISVGPRREPPAPDARLEPHG